MSDKHRERPAGRNAQEPAKQTTAQEEVSEIVSVKPPLTGMIGMHIDQQDEDAESGSPGADIDRNLAEEPSRRTP